MKYTGFKAKMTDGQDIFIHKWESGTSAPKAVVQISHGMAEHAARYELFAEKLTGSGYVVYANDHRGHGKTAGSLDNVGFFAENNGWLRVVEDLNEITLIVKESHPGLPVFMFGHSMGSFLLRTYMFLYGNRINGAIISGTAGSPGVLGDIGLLIANLEIKRKGLRGKSTLLHQLSFGGYSKAFKPTRTDFDWLSRDHAEVDKYIDDPFCGTVFTAGFYRDLLWGLKTIHKKENINMIPKNLPILILSGDKDPVGKNGKGVSQVYQSLKKAGAKDIQLSLYPDGRHEMLNETNRHEVYRDVILWLDHHTS
ncbi:MAG: alpha/beta hydrolase [Desulfobacterium sp.]|nr:alpha/beta hydrolase [Desulfobacterium sp.]